MKGLFLIFDESAKKLKDIRTLTVAGVLLAMAVILRGLGIPVTQEVRIEFSFLPICVIGMLHGPVVCAMANVSRDLIGFIIDTKSARGYSPQLSLIELAIGIVYGLLLYKKTVGFRRNDYLKIFAARLIVVGILNVCVRSYLLYTIYTNTDFSLFTATSEMWTAFGIYAFPRFVKAAVQFVFDIILLFTVLPAAEQAYLRVRAR
ncbi:MAG: folate family ECF transporter S component [Ruminococcus sp.]|nr:folate family ECF transporter S component [Ruminococcus sp.]